MDEGHYDHLVDENTPGGTLLTQFMFYPNLIFIISKLITSIVVQE